MHRLMAQWLPTWLLCIVSACLGGAMVVVAQGLPLESPAVKAVIGVLGPVLAALFAAAVTVGVMRENRRRDRRQRLDVVFNRLRTIIANVEMAKIILPPPDAGPPDQIAMNAITNQFEHIHKLLKVHLDLDAVAEEDCGYKDRAYMQMLWNAMEGRSRWSVTAGRALTVANYQSTRKEIDEFLPQATALGEWLKAIRSQ